MQSGDGRPGRLGARVRHIAEKAYAEGAMVSGSHMNLDAPESEGGSGARFACLSEDGGSSRRSGHHHHRSRVARRVVLAVVLVLLAVIAADGSMTNHMSTTMGNTVVG